MPEHPKRLALDDLKLVRAVFEVRYPEALLLWDRAGELWKQLTTMWPELQPVEARPDRTRFQLASRTEVLVELTQAAWNARAPKRNLKDFAAECNAFVEALLERLEITALSRVGLRLIYEKTTESSSEASALILAHRLLSPPEGLLTLLPSAVFTGPEFCVRTEGKAIGIATRFRAETRRVEFRPPIDLDLDPLKKEDHLVVCDFDYYTTKSLPRAQFDPESWIESGLRAIRRSAAELLSGDRRRE